MIDDLVPPQTDTPQTDTPQAEQRSAEPVTFQIPEEYKEKPYAKDIKSYGDVFKMLDNAQTLIGKKTIGIPDEKSSEEDINNFYKTLGVPDAPDGYDFETPPVLSEVYGNQAGDMNNEFKTLLHKAKLTATQAKELKDGYNDIMQKASEAANLKRALVDKDFDDLAVKTFGDKKDTTLSTAKQMLTDHAPSEFVDALRDVPNNYLIGFAGVLDNIHTKYIAADKAPVATSAVGSDAADLQSQIGAILSNPDFRDPLSLRRPALIAQYNMLIDQQVIQGAGKKH
jgi:hypothetical protein